MKIIDEELFEDASKYINDLYENDLIKLGYDVLENLYQEQKYEGRRNQGEITTTSFTKKYKLYDKYFKITCVGKYKSNYKFIYEDMETNEIRVNYDQNSTFIKE